jgi:hypothetical protein
MNLTDLIVSRCVSICIFDYIGTYIHVCVGCNISKLTLNLLEKKKKKKKTFKLGNRILYN